MKNEVWGAQGEFGCWKSRHYVFTCRCVRACLVEGYRWHSIKESTGHPTIKNTVLETLSWLRVEAADRANCTCAYGVRSRSKWHQYLMLLCAYRLCVCLSVSLSRPGLYFPLCCSRNRVGSDREMIVTADGLYYSQYIKHFRGGRAEWVGEIYRRDDVARRGSCDYSVLATGDIGVTLWYNRSITASDGGSLSVDSARFWSRWTYARSIFWPQEMTFSWR